MYEFDQTDLFSNGWKEIPGGFTGASPGTVSPLSFVGPFIPSSQDKVGLRIIVNAGQVAFIYGLDPIQTAGAPILLRVTVRADAPGAAVALAALKGDLSSGQAVDGSIATHIPATASSLVEGERRLVLLYQPDSPDVVTPIIQVAATGQSGAVSVFVDKMDVLRLDLSVSYPGSIFSSSPAEGLPPAPSTPTPVFPTPTPIGPTPTAVVPTHTPTTVPPQVTPTPGIIPVTEQEPNDSQAQAQNLGGLAPGGTINVTGRATSGGFQEDQEGNLRYIGDADFYSFNISSRLSVGFRLDWTAQADLDFYILSGGQVIDKEDSTNRPAVLERTLEPGDYLLIIISYDNPSDYTLILTAGGIAGPTGAATPSAAYPNDVSLLNGTFYQDGDVAFRYEFDGEGGYQFIGYTPLSGDVVMEQGTYSISYPLLILNHDGQTERHELKFIREDEISLDGRIYVKG